MAEKTFTSGAILCPACKRRSFLQDEPWKRVCVSCYLERKGAVPPSAPARAQAVAPIAPDMLRRLIQLCHPDKHAGSEAAATATRFLLELRAAALG
jgi:hypothetical protein